MGQQDSELFVELLGKYVSVFKEIVQGIIKVSKLLQYMKQYIGMLLCAIALLFVQAMCDLALPDYMSDIVNTGVMGGNSPYIWKFQ